MLRKLVLWAVVLFVIFYIATEPEGAAASVHHGYDALHSAA